MTHTSFRLRLIWIASILATAACDTGNKATTQGDAVADSALAADLALINRDTVVVDSIGSFQASTGGLGDTTATIAPAAASVTTKPPASRSPVPVSPVAQAEAITPRASATPSPRRTSGNPCASPAPADQQSCLRSSIAAADKRLNGIYRALIVEMRLKEAGTAARGDPPSVAQLRESQREWLKSRDDECRRRGGGKEGALWARPRARCLAELSDKRANELANDFSRLTSR